MLYEDLLVYFKATLTKPVVISTLPILIASIIIYFLSIYVHEASHKVVTLHYCRPLGMTCKIVCSIIKIFKGIKPHTESDYYTYLEERREEPAYQVILRKIAAAGYIGSFTFLSVPTLTYFLFYYIYASIPCLYGGFILLGFIVFDIYSCLSSNDLKTIKSPSTFYYKYK